MQKNTLRVVVFTLLLTIAGTAMPNRSRSMSLQSNVHSSIATAAHALPVPPPIVKPQPSAR